MSITTSVLLCASLVIAYGQPPRIRSEQAAAMLELALSNAAEDAVMMAGVPSTQWPVVDLSVGWVSMRRIAPQINPTVADLERPIPQRAVRGVAADFFECPNAEVNGRCKMKRDGYFLSVFDVTLDAEKSEITVWVTLLRRTGGTHGAVHTITKGIVFGSDASGAWTYRNTRATYQVS